MGFFVWSKVGMQWANQWGSTLFCMCSPARSDKKFGASYVHFLPWQPARQPVTTSMEVHHSGRSCLPPNNNGNPLSDPTTTQEGGHLFQRVASWVRL